MKPTLLISLFLIILFHVVGLFGMLGEHPGFFIRNTPLNLVLSSFLLLLNHPGWNFRQSLTLLFIFSGGFLVEVIGTQTGYLFGNYHYGKTLGLKVLDVPIVIGINWMMQIYIAGNILEHVSANNLVKALLASLLLVILDYFIEPVAMHFDYWQWENNHVPLTNYCCWFIISFLFLSLYYKTGFKKYNPVTGVLLILQLLMFVILNMLL